jgi:hypothetical protein
LPDGRRRPMYLHQLLMQPPDGMQVDHRNLNGLDCQRNNMRVCTLGQNLSNRLPRTDNKCGFKGVYWFSRDSCWKAEICSNSKTRHLGYFRNIEDAARAYDSAARRLHGDFARTNFVE